MEREVSSVGRVFGFLLRFALVVLVCGLIGTGVSYLLEAAAIGAVFGALIGLSGLIGMSRALRVADLDRTLTDSSYVGMRFDDRESR